MDFRRGHRDERRRRVLIDEAETRGEPAAVPPQGEQVAGTEPARRYTEAVLSQGHSQLFDLIPTRGWTILVWMGLLLSAMAGIEALYGVVALSAPAGSLSDFPAIDLAQRGSLATWLSSAMLMTGAVFGLLTYQIRRHRADDYRGRYRMWCYVVPVLVLASVDQVAGLQQTVRVAVLQAAGIPDYADALLIWTAVVLLLAGVFGVRLMIEMRGCRLAVLMVLAAVAQLAAIGCLQVGWLLADPGVFRTMVWTSLAMGVQGGLLMAVLLNVRAVHREAIGQSPVRRPCPGGKRRPGPAVKWAARSGHAPRTPVPSRRAAKRVRPRVLTRLMSPLPANKLVPGPVDRNQPTPPEPAPRLRRQSGAWPRKPPWNPRPPAAVAESRAGALVRAG